MDRVDSLLSLGTVNLHYTYDKLTSDVVTLISHFMKLYVPNIQIKPEVSWRLYLPTPKYQTDQNNERPNYHTDPIMARTICHTKVQSLQ